MSRRPSAIAAGLLALGIAAFTLTFVDAASLGQARTPARAETARLAEKLGLTDLALFNEARYTRHPSQADLHSAFQDHPMALEHFPTGSLFAPPDYESVDRKTAQPD